MAHKAEAVKQVVGLPLLVARPIDVSRLQRELIVIEEMASQAKLADKDVALPKTSQLMDQTVELNKLNLSSASDRKLLTDLLNLVKKQAPVLHISFNSDPPSIFIEKLMDWLRREIHPIVLITIGLQPSIGAGCVVRTTNKYFDFSLRKDLSTKRDLLLAKLRAEVSKA